MAQADGRSVYGVLWSPPLLPKERGKCRIRCLTRPWNSSNGRKAGIGDRCLTSVTGIACFRGETLTENLSKAQADSLLRSDLRKCCDAFREFENDALLLGVLSYNVGIFRLKGHGRIPKSRLIRKLEKGERDIYEEYVSFRCYKGKVIPSIERRRKAEFALFYIP